MDCSSRTCNTQGCCGSYMPCKYSRLSFFNFLGHLSFVKADPVAGNCAVQYAMQWKSVAQSTLNYSFER